MDSSLCCPWCELKFSDRQKCYRHKKFKHSEEYKASLLKHSSPDELTFKRCLCCNCWTLINLWSIEIHEKSALHSSLEKCNKKKRKSKSFSYIFSVSSRAFVSPEISCNSLKKKNFLSFRLFPFSENVCKPRLKLRDLSFTGPEQDEDEYEDIREGDGS